MVSTHSRLKAAGSLRIAVQVPVAGFNTQPPKGGWITQLCSRIIDLVSTHSRLKAAGLELLDG